MKLETLYSRLKMGNRISSNAFNFRGAWKAITMSWTQSICYKRKGGV